MACSRRHKSPARCNGLPPDVGLDTKVTGSDAPELDTLIGRTCLRGTQTRRQCCREHPDSGANKTAGMRAEVDDQGFIPRARVPVGMVHHPAGTSRATGQALADIPSGGLCQSRTRARSFLGHPRVILGLNPRTRTEDRRRLARETHAAGKNAERGAGRSHITYLDRLLLAPRPRQISAEPEGAIPTGDEAWA